MDTKIIFRSMDHSDAVEKVIHSKIDKVEKFFIREQNPINIEVVVEAHHDAQSFTVSFKILSTHYNIVAHSQGADIYAVIDEAAHKMMTEVARKKEKMTDAEHHKPKMM